MMSNEHDGCVFSEVGQSSESRSRFEAHEVDKGRMIVGRVLWDGHKYRFADVQDRWNDCFEDSS